MASEVDICNIALGHLGDEAGVSAISPPDGSVQATHCARIYPMARDELIEQHNWNFALKRMPLTLLNDSSSGLLPLDWTYAYAYPNLCARVVAVYPANDPTGTLGGSPPQQLIYDEQEFLLRPKTYPFSIETWTDGSVCIYTNVEYATVLYVALVTDTAKFSPLFRTALARLMASYLAGPIIKGKPGIDAAQSQMQFFEKLALPRAKASDANARRDTTYDQFIPASIAARR